MAEIQISEARHLHRIAEAERAKPEPQIDVAAKYGAMAAKAAHDVSPYLYPSMQSIRHGGEEDGAPIRIESLSDSQLETLIARLSKS